MQRRRLLTVLSSGDRDTLVSVRIMHSFQHPAEAQRFTQSVLSPVTFLADLNGALKKDGLGPQVEVTGIRLVAFSVSLASTLK